MLSRDSWAPIMLCLSLRAALWHVQPAQMSKIAVSQSKALNVPLLLQQSLSVISLHEHQFMEIRATLGFAAVDLKPWPDRIHLDVARQWYLPCGCQRYLEPLQVVPFTPAAGLLEWVEETEPLLPYLLGDHPWRGGAWGRYHRPQDKDFVQSRSALEHVQKTVTSSDKRAKAFNEVSLPSWLICRCWTL